MRFIISGPWLPSVHRRGYVIERGTPAGYIDELIVVGQFKGQVVSLPATWINHALIWWLDIHFGETDQLERVQ